MKWYKSNINSSGYTEVESGTKYNLHFNGSLGIVYVQKGDNGTYMVEISNSAGTVSEEIEVEILQQTGEKLSIEILKCIVVSIFRLYLNFA